MSVIARAAMIGGRLWERLWFAPVQARSLGVMRITLASMLIASHLALLGELHLLGDYGPISTQLVIDSGSYLRWSYLDGIADPETLRALHLAGLLPMIGALVGWKSRWMLLAALAVQVAVHHRAPWMQHGGDRLLRIWTLSMCLAPAGAALSLDDWLRRRRGMAPILTVPCTAHRLVQLQLAILYLATGIEKSWGAVWREGDALYWALSLRTFQRFPGSTEPILASEAGQLVLSLATWVVLAWELGFAAMIFWRPTRRLALAIGVFVHLGIAATMMLGSFSFATLWGYLAFWGWASLPPGDASAA